MHNATFTSVLIALILGGILILLTINLLYLKQNRELNHQHDMQLSLKQVRQYLLAYSKQQQRMPCTDGNGDGYSDYIQSSTQDSDEKNTSESSLRCQYSLGWLPEKTLGQPLLRDENGQRIWYALAKNENELLSVNGNQVALAVLISSDTITEKRAGQKIHIHSDGDGSLHEKLYSSKPSFLLSIEKFSSLGNIGRKHRLLWITQEDWATAL